MVRELNENPECTGYIVQLPLPKHIDQDVILEAMDPEKDADGLHPMNLGRLVANVSGPMKSPLPCTPKGCVELLTRHGIDLNGKRVLVVGRGVTIGRPVGLLLTRKDVNATVILAHTGTVDLPAELRQADVVIAAAGQPHMIKAGDLKPGAIVLDVGVSRVDDGNGKAVVTGDVDPAAADVAAWLSPNPGGVGPMTRAMLLANVVETAERQLAEKSHWRRGTPPGARLRLPRWLGPAFGGPNHRRIPHVPPPAGHNGTDTSGVFTKRLFHSLRGSTTVVRVSELASKESPVSSPSDAAPHTSSPPRTSPNATATSPPSTASPSAFPPGKPSACWAPTAPASPPR